MNPLLRLIEDGERFSSLRLPEDTEDPAAMRKYADELGEHFRSCGWLTKAVLTGLSAYVGTDLKGYPKKIRRWADINERHRAGQPLAKDDAEFMRDFWRELGASGDKIDELNRRLRLPARGE